MAVNRSLPPAQGHPHSAPNPSPQPRYDVGAITTAVPVAG